jgi:hypothetical protein
MRHLLALGWWIKRSWKGLTSWHCAAGWAEEGILVVHCSYEQRPPYFSFLLLLLLLFFFMFYESFAKKLLSLPR